MNLRPSGRWLVWPAAGLAILAGCGLDPKPGSESLLDWVNPEITPLQVAEMADNPYDSNDRYRGTLLLANAYFAGEGPYIALFERRIVDPDSNVRSAGARGLANHGQPRHISMLLTALKDQDVFVRREAARGLQRLHGDQAVPPLIRILKPEAEPDRDVRVAAAMALGQYPELRVLDALLVSVADDPQLAVNRAALESLRTLTGQDFGLSGDAWRAWRRTADAPFAGRRPYAYPVFRRGKYLYERLPLVPNPPNEVPGQPVGLPPDLREGVTPENPAPASGPQPPAR